MQEKYEIYGGFASVYDKFMDNIPYDDWFRYLQKLLSKYGIYEGIVVDLACGTGEMTKRLAKAGYNMIGVDVSEEMLEIARDKCGADILWLHQDMRALDLYGSASAMVCVCDGMNYICSIKELEQVFKRVVTFLDQDGVLIFDMKTEYFYQEILGNRTITDNREDASYIWENEYHEKDHLNKYLLTIYELLDDNRDLFLRTDELHQQRAYDINVVKECLENQGFSQIKVFEAFTEEKPNTKSERLYFVARKCE